MRHLLIAFAFLVSTTIPAWSQAKDTEDTGTSPRPNPVLAVHKDPLIAAYLSATLPGLGQIYAGHKGRGLMVLLGVAASLGTAAALYEPAQLELSDYDRIQYGGNGDGLLSILEVTNWEDNTGEGDAFSDLSGGRKAGIITAGVVGVGLYIWNIFDARKLAKQHNRESGFALSPQIAPDRTGAAVSLRF